MSDPHTPKIKVENCRKLIENLPKKTEKPFLVEDTKRVKIVAGSNIKIIERTQEEAN